MQQIITADYEHPLTDTCHIAFKLVKKGTFLMGSEDKEAYDDEKPVHLVNIQKDFYIGIFPVTQENETLSYCY